MRAEAEALAQEAERRGRITGVRLALDEDDDEKPWNAPPSRRRKVPPISGPLPKKIELILGDQIYIAKEQPMEGDSGEARSSRREEALIPRVPSQQEQLEPPHVGCYNWPALLPAGLRNRLIRLAAFQNPEFYRAQAMRLPTFNKPRIIRIRQNTSRCPAAAWKKRWRCFALWASSLSCAMKDSPELRLT